MASSLGLNPLQVATSMSLLREHITSVIFTIRDPELLWGALFTCASYAPDIIIQRIAVR